MPAGATYEPIATTTLSSATTYTFSSISSSYTDLRLVITGNIDTASQSLRIRFNSDTATNYSSGEFYGSGTAAGSYYFTNSTSIQTIINLGTGRSSLIWDFFSYANNQYKSMLCQTSSDQNGSGYVQRLVGLWRSTSAINAITVFTSSGNFTGTATLYGIKAA